MKPSINVMTRISGHETKRKEFPYAGPVAEEWRHYSSPLVESVILSSSFFLSLNIVLIDI